MKTFFFEGRMGYKKINPSFYTDFKNIHLTLVKSTPKKSFAQKTYFSGTFFGCTFY